MKKTLVGLAAGVGLLLLFSTSHALPIIIDLDSTDSNNAFTASFDAGMYNVEVIGEVEGGAFIAWNPWSALNIPEDPGVAERTPSTTSTGYINTYSVGIDSTANSYGDSNVYYDPLDALDNAVDSYFTLASTQDVKFYLDDINYSDNSGGISLKVSLAETSVPEPSTILLFGTAIVGLAAVGRRLKK